MWILLDCLRLRLGHTCRAIVLLGDCFYRLCNVIKVMVHDKGICLYTAHIR